MDMPDPRKIPNQPNASGVGQVSPTPNDIESPTSNDPSLRTRAKNDISCADAGGNDIQSPMPVGDQAQHVARIARDIVSEQRSGPSTSHVVPMVSGPERYDIGGKERIDSSAFIWMSDGVRGPASGQTWGDYEIGSILGSGGMGQVYRARQISLNRRCALKVMSLEATGSSRLRERFIAEAQHCAGLSSPNVVAVYGAGEHAGQLYFAMELVEGKDLHTVLYYRKKTGVGFTLDAILGIILQAAVGLREAHRKGLVHRDIKPPNLLMTDQGLLKVADFGLVRSHAERHLTRPGFAVGTPMYLSPEVALGGEADARSDIFSLGIVFYEMLTGKNPFSEEAEGKLCVSRRLNPLEPPSHYRPGILSGCDELALWMTNPDPAKRPQDMDAVIKFIESLRMGSSVPVAQSVPVTSLPSSSPSPSPSLPIPTPSPPALSTLPSLPASTSSSPLVSEATVDRLSTRQSRNSVAFAAIVGILAIGLVVTFWSFGSAGIQQTPLAAIGSGSASRQVAIRDLALLDGLVGEDPALSDLRTELAQAQSRIRALRKVLIALDGTDVIDSVKEKALVEALTELTALDGTTDADVIRWQRVLADRAAKRNRLIVALATLDETNPITVPMLGERGVDLNQLAALVEKDDPRLARWRQSLVDRWTDIEHLRNRLNTANNPRPAGEREILIEELNRLAVLEPARISEIRVITDRLRIDSARLALARKTLMDGEKLGSVHEEQRMALTTYVALVGEDADALRWQKRLNQFVDIRGRLAVLDQAITPPLDAEELLTVYATMVPPTDSDLARWRGRMDRTTELRRALAFGAANQLMAEEWQRKIAALALLVGEQDPDVIRWRAAIVKADQLAKRLDVLATVVRLPKELVDDLTQLAAIEGNTQRVQKARQRIAVLDGPQIPPWATKHGKDGFGVWCQLDIGQVPVRFRYLPGGRFVMGSAADEQGRGTDERQVTVNLTNQWWMGETEVTQELWQEVTGNNPSQNRNPRHPVERVNFVACGTFVAKLSARVPGFNPRLPTEAEWEFSCRAGAAVIFSGPHGDFPVDALKEVAWYVENAGGGTHPVGTCLPNAFGLFDLHGNVWEFCQDRYALYAAVPTINPVGTGGDQRVARGGSWGDPRDALRAANRLAIPEDLASAYMGLRIVAPVVSEAP